MTLLWFGRFRVASGNCQDFFPLIYNKECHSVVFGELLCLFVIEHTVICVCVCIKGQTVHWLFA